MAGGLKCRIIKVDNKVTEVLTELGTPSQLFRDLQRYVDKTYDGKSNVRTIDKEKDVVRERNIFKKKYLLAPDGKPTNLTTSQWELVRTPSFLSTYGNWMDGNSSLTLDEHGEPSFEVVVPNSTSVSDEEVTKVSEDEVIRAIESNEELGEITNDVLILWGIANSDTVKEALGIEGEPTFNEFIKFYNKYGTGKPLTSEDIETIVDMSNSIDIPITQFILENLNVSGVGELRTKVLNSDGLSELQNDSVVKDFISSKIKNITGEDVYGVQIEHSVTNTWSELDKVYLDNVDSIDDIVDLLPQLPNSIADSIGRDTELQNKLYQYYKNLEPVSIVRLENGEDVEIEVDKRLDSTINTILVTKDVVDTLSDRADVLSQLDEKVWDVSIDIIPSIVKDIEVDSIKVNLDLIGLSNIVNTKTASENISFFKALNGLLTELKNGELSETTKSIFSSEYRKMFNTESKVLTENIRNGKELPLVKLSGEVTMSDSDIFLSNKLIRYRNNLFVKVDVDGVYDQFTTVRDSRLPSHLFNSDTEVGSELSTEERDNVARYFNNPSTSSLFSTEEDNIKYNMSRFLFSNETLNFRKEMTDRISTFGDTEINSKMLDSLMYYPSKFYNKILKEKLNNTKDYTNILSNFYIDSEGIKVQGDISTLRQQINKRDSVLNIKEDLELHALATNNMDLLELVGSTENYGIRTPNDIRELAKNNLMDIPNYTGAYNKVSDIIITTPRYMGEVINIDNTNWYILDRDTNKYTSDYLLREGTELGVNLNYQASSVSTASVVNEITKSELEAVNARIDTCS